MKYTSSLLAVGLATLAGLTPAYAGNRVGNGGNLVLCRTPSGTVAQALLLDFYEAGLKTPARSGDEHGIAKARLDELGQLHPELARVLRARLDTMPGDIDFEPRARLVRIEDSWHLFEPSDPLCAVKQLAIRRFEPLGDEKRFVVSKDDWDLLDASSKAGLLLHEVIYEYFFKLGENDSRKARYFNALLFGGKLAKMSKAEYWTTIQKLRIPIYP